MLYRFMMVFRMVEVVFTHTRLHDFISCSHHSIPHSNSMISPPLNTLTNA